jgi:TIR domain
MRRGDRIELLKKLADRLSADDYSWDDRRLVLYQFGFSVTSPDDWEGTARAYAIWHLEDVNDETLVELDEYLFGGSSRDVLDPAILPWESGTFRLFISHTSANAELAGKLRGYFAPWRVDAFVAHSTIEPTREWERVIEAALSSCHALTALVSDDFVASRWCDQEVGYCLARRAPIVPVRLGVDPHGFIAKFQAARVEHPHTAPWIADGIFRALARHAALRELMVAPVVHRFAATTNFDGARANFPLLDEIPSELWTRDLVELTERAIEDNSQLRNANLLRPVSEPVPEATRELLAPIRERLGMNLGVETVVVDDDIPF